MGLSQGRSNNIKITDLGQIGSLKSPFLPSNGLYFPFIIETKRRVYKNRDFHEGKINKENMGLKDLILHNNHFKTHLYFSIFWWGNPIKLRSQSKRWLKLKSFLEMPEDSYPTEFVS